MMNAHHDGGFQCLNDEMTGSSLKKTGDGKKELFIHGDPFCDLFIVLIIINAGNAFFYKKNIIAGRLLPYQEMIFGKIPMFPCIDKNIQDSRGKN